MAYRVSAPPAPLQINISRRSEASCEGFRQHKQSQSSTLMIMIVNMGNRELVTASRCMPRCLAVPVGCESLAQVPLMFTGKCVHLGGKGSPEGTVPWSGRQICSQSTAQRLTKASALGSQMACYSIAVARQLP